MNGTITTLKADGTRTDVDLTRAVTLEDLQAAVGGYIEAVSGFQNFEGKSAFAFCNEEGKQKNLPANRHFPGLVGNVVIITGDKEFMREV